MKSRKNKKWLSAVAAVLVVAPVLMSVVSNYQASGVDRCVSDECKEARAKANAAQEKASEATDAARLYENKVKELAAQVAGQEAKIKKTQEDIENLKKEITKTKDNLKKKQEALAEMLVNVHFESDKEPIKILASSESISDLAEKASREDTARRQIGTAAEAVRQAKEKLENDKKEVEDLLEEQQETRKELIASRQEQQEFVDKYKNDAAAYAEVAKAERLKQMELEQKAMADNPWLFGGGTVYAGAVDTYPWRNQCPQDPDNYNFWNPVGGGYVCECVSYANWKVYEAYGLEMSWGHGYQWDESAMGAGYRVDNIPEAGAVGQSNAAPYGHVFWVESVNGDGSINVTEYNNWYSTELLLGYGSGWMFGARTISAGEAASFNYIHFR